MPRIVGVITDRHLWNGMPVHLAHDEYVTAIRDGAGALPLLIPCTDVPLASADILAAVDGLIFTGSASNVAPSHYGAALEKDSAIDAARDATALPLLRAAIAAAKPVLAICRGIQELNVALGGSLHQKLHAVPGRLDHREPDDVSVEQEYAPAHAIGISPDGLLGRISGLREAMVNSLHHQGIDRLAPGLIADATAPDGQIEAVSLPKAGGFLLGVQWHPEWRWAEDALSRAIFQAFGAALQ